MPCPNNAKQTEASSRERSDEAFPRPAESPLSASRAPAPGTQPHTAPPQCPYPHAAAEIKPRSSEITECPYSKSAAPAAAAAEANSSVISYPYASGESFLTSAIEGSIGADHQMEAITLEAREKPLKCPMGYGGGGAAKLDPLNCIICRTLFYDAAMAACGHLFCRFCIGPFTDCPLCGADCQPLGPAQEMQGTSTHSRKRKGNPYTWNWSRGWTFILIMIPSPMDLVFYKISQR